MLILSAALSLIAQDPVTDLGLIEVKGQRLHPIVRVQVNADAPLEAMVIGTPSSIRCGAEQFTYHRYMQPRQCWIRRAPGTELSLQAVAPADWGDDWRVEWQDCPMPSGRTCHLTASRADQTIKASFIR